LSFPRIDDNVILGVLGSGRKRGEWIKRAETVAMDALEFCGLDLAKEWHRSFRTVT